MKLMARLAWFSPMPPARTGVAPYSAGLVPMLGRQHEIDVFVDEPIAVAARDGRVGSMRSAHDFVWAHRLDPYDLTIFQLGNSSNHDFIWPYLFRYPGLAVLHDGRLHHARAAALLRQARAGDYRVEFARNHPGVSVDLAELATAGFDNHLYYCWPMTRLITHVSRATAVHAPLMARALLEESPGASVETIRLGHGRRVTADEAAQASARVRGRHGIDEGAVLFGVFGGLTPEKRVPQILEAFAALVRYQPSSRLILAGAPASHYDVAADVGRRHLQDRVILTGYLESDAAFTEYVSACDVSINLRWPTAREISGPWLRAIAAARPTITMDLSHTSNVPALDPRTWTMMHDGTKPTADVEPVTIAIDILDEDHSLRLAMRKLAMDPALRERLAMAGAAYWAREHSHEGMLADYERVIARAIEPRAARPELPTHVRQDGQEQLRALLDLFGGAVEPWG